jgi:hypothetical protein
MMPRDELHSLERALVTRRRAVADWLGVILPALTVLQALR